MSPGRLPHAVLSKTPRRISYDTTNLQSSVHHNHFVHHTWFSSCLCPIRNKHNLQPVPPHLLVVSLLDTRLVQGLARDLGQQAVGIVYKIFPPSSRSGNLNEYQFKNQTLPSQNPESLDNLHHPAAIINPSPSEIPHLVSNHKIREVSTVHRHLAPINSQPLRPTTFPFLAVNPLYIDFGNMYQTSQQQRWDMKVS